MLQDFIQAYESNISTEAAKMTFTQELNSWLPPLVAPSISPLPKVGSPAPSKSLLTLPLPDRRPAVVSFLRHCGCPFAEKTLLRLRTLAAAHPEVAFIAVSHSNQEATEKWLTDIGGAEDKDSNNAVQIVVDDATRSLYRAWGLGYSGLWHVLNPSSLREALRIGKEEAIGVRSTESGSRWQRAGSFAVDKAGIVRWTAVPDKADEFPEFEEGIRAVHPEM